MYLCKENLNCRFVHANKPHRSLELLDFCCWWSLMYIFLLHLLAWFDVYDWKKTKHETRDANRLLIRRRGENFPTMRKSFWHIVAHMIKLLKCSQSFSGLWLFLASKHWIMFPEGTFKRLNSRHHVCVTKLKKCTKELLSKIKNRFH